MTVRIPLACSAVVASIRRATEPDPTDRHEHFSETDATRFLHLLLRVGSVALVITPAFDMPQRSALNPLEGHRSFCPASKLRSAGASRCDGYIAATIAASFAVVCVVSVCWRASWSRSIARTRVLKRVSLRLAPFVGRREIRDHEPL